MQIWPHSNSGSLRKLISLFIDSETQTIYNPESGTASNKINPSWGKSNKNHLILGDVMKKISILIFSALLTLGLISLSGCSDKEKGKKPSPDTVIKMLQQGNERFVGGKSEHPNMDKNRLIQAGKENQADYAYATVITCSDSRVPVEAVFDAGIMDIFVVRVAGNVCDTDEVGSIEYGLAHVNTPVMLVLGHTQCGAVTAVAKAVQGKGHALERNIPPLVDNIEPAVQRAIEIYPHAKGNEIIPLAIEENVWISIRDLFMKSPSTRNLVKNGQVKVVGAIYDVGTGKINWLKQARVTNILYEVEANPERAIEAMAVPHKAEAKQVNPVPKQESKTTQHG